MGGGISSSSLVLNNQNGNNDGNLQITDNIKQLNALDESDVEQCKTKTIRYREYASKFKEIEIIKNEDSNLFEEAESYCKSPVKQDMNELKIELDFWKNVFNFIDEYDPLESKSDEWILDAIVNEDLEIKYIDSGDSIPNDDDDDGMENKSDKNEQNKNIAISLIATEYTGKMPQSGNKLLASSVVHLDLTNTADAESIQTFLNSTRWLRSVNLTGCSLNSTISFNGLSHLLSLNLCFLSNLDFTLINFQPIAQSLKQLYLDDCNLCNIPPSMACLTNIITLSLNDNEIDDLSELTIFFQQNMNAIQELDLRENPVVDHTGYIGAITNTLKQMRILDNKILNTSGSVLNKSLNQVDGIQDAVIRGDTVADQNEDRGSCSCIEGAPCLVEYTCKDWKHRFEIAKLAKENGKLG